MSLLDDVSIVVTPNGYKAGELYAVIPVPTEGAELVTDGGFPTGTTAWTLQANASIGNNELTLNGSSNTVYALQNLYSSGLYNGKTLQFTYEIISNTLVGGGDFRGGGITGGSLFPSANLALNSTVGTHTVDIVINSTGINSALDIFITAPYTSGSLVIDNISVKEITSADMDVTRATAGTRVDENGLVNYAEVIGSELVANGDFATDSDWNKLNGSTISGGVGNIIANGSISSTGNNWSLHQHNVFNPSTRYRIQFRARQTSGSGNFNVGYSYGFILNEVITSSFVDYTVDFVTSSNGWENELTFGGLTIGDTFEIDNVSVKEVTRDNVPRIDYTGGGCPHILAEPKRTNLITYSSDFSDSSWTPTDITITNNAAASPEGVNNASKIILDNGSSASCDLRVPSTNVTLGTSYTFSVFAKAGEFDKIELDFSNSRMGVSYVLAELTNGTITHRGVDNTADSIEDYGNGWYRITLTGTAIATGTTALIFRLGANPTGDGTSGFYIFGADFQEGSYPTSYIPTSGSTVTRNQDIFSRDGIGSLINSTEGVLFAEIAALSDDGTIRALSLSDGTSSNRILIYYSSTSNQVVGLYTYGGSTQVNITNILSDSTEFIKCAFKFKENDCAFWINGVEVGTDTSSTAFSANTLNDLGFDSGAGGSDFYGKVKQLQVYNTALTDEQLTSLTS